jgi:putative flippase GtrA
MKFLSNIRDLIISILNWLYPPFSRFMSRQIFRYAATGGFNTLLDIILYTIIYSFILNGRYIHLPFVSISDHIAAFLMVFPITFTVGFLFAKYITFTNSNLKGKVQLIRYFTTVCGALFLKYILLKLFVEVLDIHAVVSNILTIVFVVAYSYFAQNYFSFRSKKSVA